MENEEIILTALCDEPLSEVSSLPAAPAPAPLKETLEQWMSEADTEGYLTCSYGALLRELAATHDSDVEFLLENSWMVHRWLRQAGFAAAPDAMLERRKLKETDSIILYATDEEVPFIRTRLYKKALLLLKFATLMLPGMEGEELRVVGGMIDEWVKAPRYRRHLRGLLRWFNIRRRLLDKRTRLMAHEIIDAADATKMIHQLATLAASRGFTLTHNNIYQLERLIGLLGGEPSEVHSLLHRAGTGTLQREETPQRLLTMDTSRLETIKAQTQEAQALLDDLFQETQEETPAIQENNDHSALFETLMSRPEWRMQEVEKICSEHNTSALLALEELNELALEQIGDTVADIEGDIIYITQDYKIVWKPE